MTTLSNHLNRSTWECSYHVVFTPKYRKKVLYGLIRKDLKDVFQRLAKQKECVIKEGRLMPDHIHILISIPPKHSAAQVLGFLKGKSSIWVAQNIANKQRNFVGHKFWARGYYVSTVGADEKTIRAYIQNQEFEDKRIDNLNLFNRQYITLTASSGSYPNSQPCWELLACYKLLSVRGNEDGKYIMHR